MRAEVGSLKGALDALSALIEAAPFPMWHRGPDLRLAMVNRAYVAAVEADDALSAVKAGIELVDESEERSPLSQAAAVRRSEEHTSELQSLMRISYAVFCLKKKKHKRQRQAMNTTRTQKRIEELTHH